MAVSSSLADLPGDILLSVLHLLSVNDILCMRKVCRFSHVPSRLTQTNILDLPNRGSDQRSASVMAKEGEGYMRG